MESGSSIKPTESSSRSTSSFLHPNADFLLIVLDVKYYQPIYNALVRQLGYESFFGSTSPECFRLSPASKLQAMLATAPYKVALQSADWRHFTASLPEHSHS